MERGLQGPGDKTREGDKAIFRQETHQGEEGLGQATTGQEALGRGEQKGSKHRNLEDKWGRNGQDEIRSRSRECSITGQIQRKGRLHTALSYISVFKLMGQSLYHVCG